MKPLRVLISGGGIAGYTLAALLVPRGIHPVIVEKRPEGYGLGYGLGLWPLGARILKGLGLYTSLVEKAEILNYFSLADADETLIKTYQVQRLAADFGPILMVHRGALVNLLRSACEGLDIRLGTTIETLEWDGDEARVSLSDGAQATFDLVVGCDGIGSTVRKLAFPEAEPVHTGWGGMGGWIEMPDWPADAMNEYWEPTRAFAAIYPTRDRCCAFVGYPTDPNGPGGWPGDAVHFKKRDGITDRIIDRLTRAHDTFQVQFRVLRMDHWQKQRVVLVGDACSSYFPFGGLGIGASMAMESAAVLADELSRAGADTIPHALRLYERRRLPRIAGFEKGGDAVIRYLLNEATDPAGMLELQKQNFAVFRELLENPL